MLIILTFLVSGLMLGGTGMNSEPNQPTDRWWQGAEYLNYSTPLAADWGCNIVFSDYHSCIRSEFIIKQNTFIIEQNKQILKNQEILKCYELHKQVYLYAYKFDGILTVDTFRTGDKLEAFCGQ